MQNLGKNHQLKAGRYSDQHLSDCRPQLASAAAGLYMVSSELLVKRLPAGS